MCVVRGGAMTGDACWCRCFPAGSACWNKWCGIASVNCAPTGVSWFAPSKNCSKRLHRWMTRNVRRNEKSVDREAMAAKPEQTSARRWWAPSQRWAALLKQREEQVFLLVTLLIGALVGATVVAFIVLTERFGARIDAAVAPAWRRLVVPILGSLSMGFLLFKYFPHAPRTSVPHTQPPPFAPPRTHYL